MLAKQIEVPGSLPRSATAETLHWPAEGIAARWQAWRD
jgi:hypothetical protein